MVRRNPLDATLVVGIGTDENNEGRIALLLALTKTNSNGAPY